MKILFTGGGSGGHFYPIIAIAESIKEISEKKHLVSPSLFFIAPEAYNQDILSENKIIFKKSSAGKARRYFSLLNIIDLFKTLWGIIKSVGIVFSIYPDVIFGKGGFGSFPTLFAAKILRIPVVIHESDSVPGRVNLWASKFARRIAISWKEAAEYFPQEKTAYTGQPVRKEFKKILKEGAREFLKLEEKTPIILILGGSLGSQLINDHLVSALGELVKKYQVIHQTGKNNLDEVTERAEVVLENNPNKARYHAFDYLNNMALRMSAGASDLIVSRAGSTIFEIASWNKPSIIIPITDSNGDHQRKNAFNYERSGACSVVEEINLTSNILVSEINRILENPTVAEKMTSSAKNFAKPDAADKIAEEILNIALEHER
ncbi:MAG: UDP-N-acetylglucosamine--N-acetylmuramyl-(pentapeptide) pyrophosphoryl-undecaprenol N-acetylglucosamine transferase [Patescibacteria group bacterium]